MSNLTSPSEFLHALRQPLEHFKITMVHLRTRPSGWDHAVSEMWPEFPPDGLLLASVQFFFFPSSFFQRLYASASFSHLFFFSNLKVFMLIPSSNRHISRKTERDASDRHVCLAFSSTRHQHLKLAQPLQHLFGYR